MNKSTFVLMLALCISGITSTYSCISGLPEYGDKEPSGSNAHSTASLSPSQIAYNKALGGPKNERRTGALDAAKIAIEHLNAQGSEIDPRDLSVLLTVGIYLMNNSWFVQDSELNAALIKYKLKEQVEREHAVKLAAKEQKKGSSGAASSAPSKPAADKKTQSLPVDAAGTPVHPHATPRTIPTMNEFTRKGGYLIYCRHGHATPKENMT